MCVCVCVSALDGMNLGGGLHAVVYLSVCVCVCADTAAHTGGHGPRRVSREALRRAPRGRAERSVCDTVHHRTIVELASVSSACDPCTPREGAACDTEPGGR